MKASPEQIKQCAEDLMEGMKKTADDISAKGEQVVIMALVSSAIPGLDGKMPIAPLPVEFIAGQDKNDWSSLISELRRNFAVVGTVCECFMTSMTSPPVKSECLVVTMFTGIEVKCWSRTIRPAQGEWREIKNAKGRLAATLEHS